MLRIVRKGFLATARNLESQGKYRKAIVIYEHLIEHKDIRYPFEVFQCYKRIGDCYYRLKDYAAALTYYKVAEIGFVQCVKWDDVTETDKDIIKVQNCLNPD